MMLVADAQTIEVVWQAILITNGVRIMQSRLTSPAVVMALAALTLFGVLAAFSEKMPFCSGLGFDGIGYAYIAKNFDQILAGSLRLDLASFNRFLPSLLCRLTLLGLGVSLTDQNIVRFFTVYDVLLLAFGAWLWADLSLRAKFSATSRWLGFVALFCSHAALKYNVFYATLTDVTAMTLGLAMLWAYLRHNEPALVAATLVGCITWPTLLPQGLVLFLFPSRPLDSKPAPVHSAGLTAALLLLAIGRFFIRHEAPPPEASIPVLGAALEMLYLGLALFHLFNAKALYCARTLRVSLSLPRLVLAAVAILAIPLALWQLTGFRINLANQGEVYLFQAVRLGIKYPGEFLVAHALYFGPWVLLLVSLFPWAAAKAREAGLGFLLVCSLSLVQSLTPLSRQLTAAMPFFVYLLVGTMDNDARFTRRFFILFTALSLLVSKVWLRFIADSADPEHSFSFPLYVSSTGCWMSFSFYWMQGLTVLALLVCFLIFLHRGQAQLRP